MELRYITVELKRHAPFTLVGTATGIIIMSAFMIGNISTAWSTGLFWVMHPIHVILSAQTTTAMFRKHGGKGILRTLAIGYFGAVGIATLSDSIIPFVGEWMLQMPNRGIHFGFIEKWWLVNPLALLGIATGSHWPKTRFPHAGHVLLSTWASLFHIMMALAEPPGLFTLILITVFLFLAVWAPCCTSDIVFPLLFVQNKTTKLFL